MSVKRLTPNSIANLFMADEAWHDSEYVAAADYDAAAARIAELEATVAALREALESIAQKAEQLAADRYTPNRGFWEACAEEARAALKGEP